MGTSTTVGFSTIASGIFGISSASSMECRASCWKSRNSSRLAALCVSEVRRLRFVRVDFLDPLPITPCCIQFEKISRSFISEGRGKVRAVLRHTELNLISYQHVCTHLIGCVCRWNVRADTAEPKRTKTRWCHHRVPPTLGVSNILSPEHCIMVCRSTHKQAQRCWNPCRTERCKSHNFLAWMSTQFMLS